MRKKQKNKQARLFRKLLHLSFVDAHRLSKAVMSLNYDKIHSIYSKYQFEVVDMVYDNGCLYTVYQNNKVQFRANSYMPILSSVVHL